MEPFSEHEVSGMSSCFLNKGVLVYLRVAWVETNETRVHFVVFCGVAV